MRWPERVTLLTSENEEVGEDEEMSLMQVGGREEGLEDEIRRATSDDEEVSDDEDMRMRSNWGRSKGEEERGLRVV